MARVFNPTTREAETHCYLCIEFQGSQGPTMKPGWPSTQIHLPLPTQVLGLKVCATTTLGIVAVFLSLTTLFTFSLGVSFFFLYSQYTLLPQHLIHNGHHGLEIASLCLLNVGIKRVGHQWPGSLVLVSHVHSWPPSKMTLNPCLHPLRAEVTGTCCATSKYLYFIVIMNDSTFSLEQKSDTWY